VTKQTVEIHVVPKTIAGRPVWTAHALGLTIHGKSLEELYQAVYDGLKGALSR
jgi:hypothetical protein